MNALYIDGCFYKIHPIFIRYSASLDGKKINVEKKEIEMIDNVTIMSKTQKSKPRLCRIRLFTWECFNDPLKRHKNDNIKHNRLSNLLVVFKNGSKEHKN